MTNSYDEKIMNFDVNEGYDAFVKLFNEEEIKEMRECLEESFEYCDYSSVSEKELPEVIIIDYVREWLIQNIRGNTYDGTRKLFNILYMM